MWWFLAIFWLGGSILVLPILCLRERLVERSEEKVEKALPQQAGGDLVSPHLRADNLWLPRPKGNSLQAQRGVM